jgi:hypothetical protein
VVGLGVAVGASHARAVGLIAQGFLLVVLAVTVYALGQKVVPGLHVSGLFNLNQTGQLPRLQEPLGYWNALALMIDMGVPIALALTADRTRSAATRLSAACGLSLMFLTIPLTYSRGGLVALAAALVVAMGLNRDRVRALAWLLATALASVPAILVGLLLHRLSAANVPLGTREGAGGVLALAILVGLGALLVGGRRILAIEPRLRLSAAGARTARRAVLAGVGILVLAALLGLGLSHRGLTGTLSHLWHGFTHPGSLSDNNPQRLLSADSYRWLWWREAATAFSARPWQGWGAGSFPVLHLLHRQNTLPVQQPHSVPLQFLAETGVIGGILGLGAFALLVAGAAKAVRSRADGREHLLAVALLAAVLAYGIHCLYDWDWNIPALSLPAFLFLGVVSGRRAGPLPGSPAEPPVAWLRPAGRGPVLRALALAGATVWLCVFALSIGLPQLAADRASTALVKASSTSRVTVRAALADASLAAQLDPLSDAGPKAEAEIAQRLSRPQAGRVYFQDAVAIDPSDPQAWLLLAFLDNALGDKAGAFAAAQRAIDLDPLGATAHAVVLRRLGSAPPSSSATRYPTPPAGP